MLLPIGYDNFKEIIANKTLNFIDKSLFIKEVFDDSATKVAVMTRPRRFGKTLALSMLHHFLAAEINGSVTAGLFNNLKITQCGDDYMRHQGKYPVVFLTLKGVKDKGNFDNAYQKICELITELFDEHAYLLESQKLSYNQKTLFELILTRKANRTQIEDSLKTLTGCLAKHHNVKPWLLIDEYDTPMQAAYVDEYFQEMARFMRAFFGEALKSNSYLERAVITGILRIAKESLFSGLNNLKIYSILSSRYSEYFGFTEPEVEAILNEANLADRADEIKCWYNGYQVGTTVVYNPWSIANCIDEKGFIQTYWVNTSDNQLIKDLLKQSSTNFKAQLELLMQGKNIRCMINENMVFQYLNASPSAVWSLLLMSGYLKPLSSRITHLGTECELAIPNREVRDLYAQMIVQWLSGKLEIEWFKKFVESLITGDMDTFKKGLENIILQNTSYHDFAKKPEAFFHGLLLGFMACLHNNGYEVQSNKESGLGRHDIMIIPDDKTKLGIIIELKNCKSDSQNNNKNLMKLAQDALQQIDEKKYPEALKQSGITTILKIGIGFCGKEFELVSSAL